MRDTPSRSDQLVIAVSQADAQATDFGFEQLVAQITNETLTRSGTDGRAMPRLAESWSWERDERRLRLKLRPKILLHDGRRFDSQLAAEAVAAAIAKRANQAAHPALRDVTAAIPDGPLDVLLDLSRRSSALPEDLTVVLDVPAGPYRPVSRSEADIELERFEQFYLGTPSIQRVILRPFPTLRTAWASLLRGEVDVVYDVPADALEFIRSADVRVVPLKRWYQYAIAFNARTGPLRSAAVRRALNMAVDRESLVRAALNGAGSPSSGPLWPEYWAADPSIATYAFDPAQAGALLDSAGYPLKPSNTGAAPARFRITCLVPANFSVVERIALQVQKDLFNVGVDLRFRVVSLEEFGRLMGTGQFEASLVDMNSGPTPSRAYVFWASAQRFKGAYNVFGYENAESERLFEILRTTRNEAAVRSATRRLQRVLLDDPPALFLAWTERARAIRQEFTVPNEPGVDPVFSLWRWTRRADTLIAASRQ